MSELEAILTLCHTPGLGSIRILKLIQEFGSAKNAILARNIKTPPSMQRDLELCDKHSVEIISYQDPRYPKELLELRDYPPILYIKGKLPGEKKIGVVGTRIASIYGLESASNISQELAENGAAVVSGLARGIDTAAHLGALKSGTTIAVLGSGLANIYPKENISLADKIAEKGILVSEFSMQTPPSKENFPKRNRLVSGLSESVLLIEAPIKSGAMITMNLAFLQKKKLFALPGRVDMDSFQGNLELLKSQRATLVRDARDVLDITTGPKMRGKMPQLTKDEEDIIKLLPKIECSIEEIGKITKFPISKLNVVLMGLVLKKVMREFPGKIYKLQERID